MRQVKLTGEPRTTKTLSKVTRLPDRKQLTTDEALDDFIENAKGLRPFGNTINWDAMVWDIEEFESTHNAHKVGRGRITFTQHAGSVRVKVAVENLKPFSNRFSDFVKAVVVHRHVAKPKTASNHMVLVRACRYLYDELAPTELNPVELTRHHFDTAISAAQAREAHASAYRVGVMLGELSDVADRRRLTKVDIGFRNPVPRPSGHDKNSDPAKQRRQQMLPSDEVFEALYDLANRDLSDVDCILMRFTELLVVGGFRPGEAAALECAENLIVREPAIDERTGMAVLDGEGRQVDRVGLRYFPKKNGNPYTKWLPSASVPLALRAVEDLMRLCADARHEAGWLERNPGQVRVAVKLGDDELLDMAQVVSVVGLVARGRQFCKTWGVQFISDSTVAPGDQRTRLLVRLGDLRKALAADRYDKPLVSRNDAPDVPLSDALIVFFQNQTHAERATLRCLVRPLSETQMRDFLVGRLGKPSVFARYGYRNANGETIKVTPKQFRHWLNTIAQEGGQLSDLEIARWMGRKYIGDNEAYNHMTGVQLTDMVRSTVLSGSSLGELSKIVVNASVSEKEEIVTTQVGAVHHLGNGLCSHDYAQSPCPHALSCMGGCGEYWRTKGDAGERMIISTIMNNTTIQLQHARKELDDGTWGASDWVDHHERIVCGCKKALAVDDDATVPDGALVQVFPQGRVQDDPE